MKSQTFAFIWFVLFFLTSCDTKDRKNETGEKGSVSLEEKIGQLLLVGFRGMTLEDTSAIIRQIRAGKVGGVVLYDYDVVLKKFDRNIESPTQVKALINQLQSAAKTPLWVSIDQEGGKVLRLKPGYGFPDVPSAQYLGAINDLDTTTKYAEINSQNLADLGFNLNFTPVVDLNIEKEQGAIGKYERSFSEDPAVVVPHALAVMKAHLTQGVVPVLKHFPGHGSASGDSHLGITDVTDTWQEVELKPYEEIIQKGNCPAVMTAHVFNRNIDEQYPATLSQKNMNILRERFNFQGVVFSDDMQMDAIAKEYGLEEALVLSINAGVDVMVFGNNLAYDDNLPDKFQQIILAALDRGAIKNERIEEAYQRVKALKMLMK